LSILLTHFTSLALLVLHKMREKGHERQGVLGQGERAPRRLVFSMTSSPSNLASKQVERTLKERVQK